MFRLAFVLLLMSFAVVSLRGESSQQKATETDKPVPVSFHRDILPIFRANCLGCHQGAKNLGEYVMTRFDSLQQGGESGEPSIVPGNPDASYLISQITPIDGHAEMPDEPAKPLSGSEIELIRRWISEGANNDSPSQEELFDAEHPPTYQNPPAITSMDVSPDGTLIAVSGYHEVFVINAKTNQRLQRLVGSSPRINSVRFSPDSKRLAVAGGTPVVSGEIQVWNVTTAKLELSKSVTYDTLSGVRWSPDGKQISFGGGDNSVRAIDSSTGEQVLFQGAHEDWVLDTIYTVDGKHLVSVARDMSCKLTEVGTERFVDNITSITPGALAGGLNSVERHPTRDELFLGGADGVAKVYRVFRQTERQIGDDGNLVRQLPAMNGRIFSVAISPDGNRLAAAATLNGQSEVRVWNYDFDGTMSEEIKRLTGKRLSDLSEAEKETLAKYRNLPVTQIWQNEIPETAVYSIRFEPDQSLLVAGTDGVIRRYDPAGKIVNTMQPLDASLFVSGQQSAPTFDPHLWAARLPLAVDQPTEVLPAPDQIVKLEITPAVIELQRALDYSQLLATAILNDGSSVDVTRSATWKVPSFAVMTRNGMLRPSRNGDGRVIASFANFSATATLHATNVKVDTEDSPMAVDFIRDVNPVLSRLGCNQGTCHGAQAGKNGFKLSLRGYDPLFDLRALTDDHAARRINSSNPDHSLMLQKPLGLAPHQGGTLMTTTDPSYAILRSWIADGCKLDLNSPRVTRIELFPNNPVANQLGSRQQIRVVAHYDDGLQRDVTAEAFITSGNTEVAEANSEGLLTAIRRGEAPILARYEGSYAVTTLTVMGKRDEFQWQDVPTWNRIDELVSQKWQRMKITPSELCTDEAFLRRVYLDLTGMPPSSDATRDFIADSTESQRKRSALIDKLISSDDYVEYWTNKWADLLQVNRKFLGVDGSAAYRAWIRESVAKNQPYDEFAKNILTATGSNKANPPSSYYKVLRAPEETMENTTHLFLGVRFNCNKCHDHPFERWTQNQYYETAAFFSRVSLRADPASGKETIGGSAVDGAQPLYEEVFEADQGEMKHQRTGKEVSPKFPYQLSHEVKAEGSRRDQLAAWMTNPDNPYFVRSYVNRVWAYMTGVGLIEPIDDIRASNPPTNPELLDYLADQFVESGFDRQQLVRLICNSRTYQLSVKTNQWNQDDVQNYSHALPRRLSAEVLFDTVHAVTGSISSIPGVPKGTRAAELPDAGVKLADGFLQSLGSPVRESACECERSSDLQLGPVMALVSGPTIGNAISDANNDLHRIVSATEDDAKLVEEMFLRTMSRLPMESEVEAFKDIRAEIHQNHESLVAALKQRESWWAEEQTAREAQRVELIRRAEEQLATAIEAAKPSQNRLAEQRVAKIAEAEAKLVEEEKLLVQRLAQWEQEQTDTTEWFPLIPKALNASNGASLRVLEDRSVLASGNSDKGTYQLTFNTSLPNITGIRIETLPIDFANGRGPGLSDASNFVLTELEVSLTDKVSPDQVTRVPLTGGLTDFTQNGHTPAQVIDGNLEDQLGWAIYPSTLYGHWLVFQTKEPFSVGESQNLVVELHQSHNAAKHRLGRFRISFTTSKADKLPLGLADSYQRLVSTAADQRTDEDNRLLSGYFESVNPSLKAIRDAVAAAKAPVPPDAGVVEHQSRLDRAKQPVAVDAALERLRADVAQSEQQIKNERLTATEDLVWALINSPDFLFNR